MLSRIILDKKRFSITVDRLCSQVLEDHGDFSDTVIIGMQPRGVLLAKRILSRLEKTLGNVKIQYGDLDVTFFRDDFRRRDSPIIPGKTNIDFLVEDKKVLLIDDVLYTGRTVRAALDALVQFGRPKKVEYLALIDRKFSRDLPIEANYVGWAIDSIDSEKVIVKWKETDGEDAVWLIKRDIGDESAA
ncbi:MAG: bifunctional pyr operon transcriptional regulator/uracil phosphoribosyltransferase PyrR [Bacteroidia bacterium]|nr:bifunctional pyr operon transcriptional regulator/uracil phosphoribosyltransferase PyrR [Bacteroidia bacterium]